MRWIERHRYFLDFTLASMWRRKGKNISLVLVFAMVVFLIGSVVFFSDAIRMEAAAILEDAPEMIVQRTIAGRHDLIPLEYAENIRRIRGVRSVKARLWGYYYHPAARNNYTLMVPEQFAHENGAVEVGHGVRRTWPADERGRLYFKAYDGQIVVLSVAKTFKAETDLVGADLILTSEPTFRRLFGVPKGAATDLSVRIRNQRECQTIADKIVSDLPDTRAILKEDILRTYDAVFDWRSGYIVVLLSGAIAAFIIFAWDKATGLSAEERTEIGILKGLGWDSADILFMKFWEGAVISLTAFLIGIAAAYIHVFFASAPLFAHALKGWAVLYPAFTLNPAVNVFQLGVLFFLTVVPYTLITLVPTWRVSVTDPDTVMRN